MGIFDGIIGSVVSGIGGVISNAMNADQAQQNRDFQMMMSNTAYQRGMDDMKKAGLNPILAYQKGPASSPTGATAVATNVGEAMVNSYNNSARTSADNARTEAETGKVISQNDLVKQELENAKATFNQIQANTAKTLADTTNVEADTRLKEAVTTGHSAENVSKKLDAERLDTFAGRWSALLGRGLKELNPLQGGVGMILRGGR